MIAWSVNLLFNSYLFRRIARMTCQEARAHINFLIEFFMDLENFERKKYKDAMWFYENHKNFQKTTPKQFQECIRELEQSINMVYEKYNFKYVHASMKHELPPIPEEDPQPRPRRLRRRNAFFLMH